MKLYIMKQEAVDFLKDNMQSLYGRYYTEPTNKWIGEVYGDDPFVEYKEIPDFVLAPIDYSALGEVDFKNCKIVYENLLFLSESQAGDERLWAGLAHTVFYPYMRERYRYAQGKIPKTAEKEAGEIRSRFFYKSAGRGGLYRNTLARAWWVGHNTYDPQNVHNHFDKLDLIGSNDISSKILEFFYNFSFSSNTYIMDAIADGLRHFRDEDKYISPRKHLRPAMSHLNAVGGAVILDCLPKEEITDIFVSAIEGIMQGDAFPIDVAEDDDEIETDEISEGTGADATVVLGCKITIQSDDLSIKKYKYEQQAGTLPPFLSVFTGKSVGDKIVIQDVEYTIIEITF